MGGTDLIHAIEQHQIIRLEIEDVRHILGAIHSKLLFPPLQPVLELVGVQVLMYVRTTAASAVGYKRCVCLPMRA